MKKLLLILFLSLLLLIPSGFAAHELTHWVQATKNPTINPGDFTFGFPQMGWTFEYLKENPTHDEVNQFLIESAAWENEALFVQLILTPLITILMFPGLALLEVHRCAS